MPELPEVEVVRRSLESKILNLDITGVDILNPKPIKYNILEDFVDRVTNRKIIEVARRGKFLILYLAKEGEAEENFIIHLGMTGAFIYSDGDYSSFPASITNHIFVKLNLSNGHHLFYSDYRRFGSLRVVTDNEFWNGSKYVYSHLKTLRELGPEPFDDEAEDIFLNNIRKPKYQPKMIKDVILDQTIVAGIGNIYANEACAKVGVHPTKMVAELDDSTLRELFRAARDLMLLSIEMGGSSIKDYVDGEGNSGTFQTTLTVYNQANCKTCNTLIEVFQINKRATYACPTCQIEG